MFYDQTIDCKTIKRHSLIIINDCDWFYTRNEKNYRSHVSKEKTPIKE